MEEIIATVFAVLFVAAVIGVFLSLIKPEIDAVEVEVIKHV